MRAQAYWSREWRQACRQPAEFLHGVWFCLIVATLFPIALSTSPQTMAQISPAVIWLAAILSSLLSLEKLFRDEKDNGTLEQIWIAGQGFWGWVVIKVTMHWLFACLPLIMLSPLIGYTFGLTPSTLIVVFGSLLLGTPTLIILGSIAAALTLNVKKSGLLLGLLVLPLNVPIFIFGIAAIEFAQYNLDVTAQLSLLLAMLLLALAFGPLMIAYALRLSIQH